ncbi:hydroxyethylthiazole kinase [Methanoculleus bourgensis]|uniref:hydroxyethylthiazole kinase n=1 Tax=Methanoculleus bourgensis TaxID=83986 RepID=UPI0022EDF13F|nr:hydroxyethylthiazole kinase [Methanoculleus bourgensis]GLI45489.1 hydroxyethylthiazole kinase [Methanoculleus bourgensis]
MPGNTTEDSSANLMDGSILAGLLAAVRSHRPLVHHITNSVTINDCANITISAGAAPVMAEAPEEVAEMVSAAGALVLNIGTLSQGQVDAMLIAGRRANVLGIPVILDPVGAGATRFRTETAWRLLDSLDVAVLKGNTGEIGVLAGTGGSVRGVDSGGIAGDPVETVRECVRATGTVVAMTGDVDVIADKRRVFQVRNGNPMMDHLSGTGCMAASVTASFAAIADDYAVSSAAALAAFGLAGERAAAGARGPYSFRTALFDELSVLTPGDLAEHARLEGPHGV